VSTTIASATAFAGSDPATAATSAASAPLLGRIERLPLSRWHLKARIVIGTATFFDGIDFLAIALALPVLAGAWQLTPIQVGLLISGSAFGQLIGAVGFGLMAERYGRIPSIATTVVIFGLCGIGCALSWDFYSLLVFRFIQGIGMGAEVPVAASYINEIAPAKQRGRFVLLYEFIFAVGVLAAGLIGRWTIPAFGWQSIFWIGAVPALLIVPFIARLPESPRWLIGRGRLDEAEKAVTRIEQEITRAGHTLPPAKDAIPSIIGKGTLRELLSERYRKRTIAMWLIWICIGFVSWPLTTWLPTMFKTVYQLPVDTALTYGLITTSGAIVTGTLTCSLLIDIVGRRRWFMMAFGIAALAMLAVWISGAQPVLLVVALAAVTMFFIASMNLAIYVYTPENYPTRLRTMGMGICSAWSRIAGMISPVVIGWWLAAEGMAAVFLLLGAFGVIGALVTFLFAEESRWKPLEELSP
jgi:MFS transporter, putative metabolite:H+ symporter